MSQFETLPPSAAEWLETDGLGGFASGTVGLVRTRRYHGLLQPAVRPPAERTMLVNGVEVFVERAEVRAALSSHEYQPGVIHPDGQTRIVAFAREPWPRWRFRLEDGTEIEHELFLAHGAGVAALSWRVVAGAAAGRLTVRPLLSGRDFHATHRENGAFRFAQDTAGGWLRCRPYESLPAILLAGSGSFEAGPDWYRNFRYSAEGERGLDDTEDLASPGTFRFDLARGPAVLLLAAEGLGAPPDLGARGAASVHADLARAESARRSAFATPLDRAADAYLVRRGAGRTIIAGYPWFGDWGRDTFIALRGLCLATGRRDDARAILLEWAGAVSEGMLPNRFPDRGEAPEYNSVDAALWYVAAVHEFLVDSGRGAAKADRAALGAAVVAILDGYSRGTRYGIRADSDALLACGERGVQLTWMDAKVGERVITPRTGKPVEIQALWINALEIGARFERRFAARAAAARAAFAQRFWNESAGSLYDVVDVDHVAGTADGTFRPNQIFACGGLPFPLLAGDRARAVVDAVDRRLWTPLGLRSLAPGARGYAPRYTGGPAERDAAYHQGTVWPWLVGAFADAWVRSRGGTPAAKRTARERYLAPLYAHLEQAGLGHVSEIADADPPHTPRGCPFQAWSLGELLWADRRVLAE